jgi:uncharacterized protein YaaN involved in tellurite resistance
MKIEDLLNEIAVALEISKERLSPETTSEQIDEWDSLGQISILARLDLVYDDITERVPDLATALSVQELYRYLKAAGL